jgi:hypothetical protein
MISDVTIALSLSDILDALLCGGDGWSPLEARERIVLSISR